MRIPKLSPSDSLVPLLLLQQPLYSPEATFLHLTQRAERESSLEVCPVEVECFQSAVENPRTGRVLCGVGIPGRRFSTFKAR